MPSNVTTSPVVVPMSNDLFPVNSSSFTAFPGVVQATEPGSKPSAPNAIS